MSVIGLLRVAERTPAAPGCRPRNPCPGKTAAPPRSHRRGAHDARQQPVGDAGQRVLLEQHRRVAAQRREQQHRTRGKAADADDHVGAVARDHAPRVDGRERQQQRIPRSRSTRDLPFKPGHANQLQRESLARHDARFDAAAPCRQTTICAAGSRRLISRASAMPGYRCPPVPPPAMSTRTGHAAPVSTLGMLRDVQQHAQRPAG